MARVFRLRRDNLGGKVFRWRSSQGRKNFSLLRATKGATKRAAKRASSVTKRFLRSGRFKRR